MCFTIFQNDKTSFQSSKRRSLKSRGIEIFAKGLTHGFGPKLVIFPPFFFRHYRAGKCVLRYSRTKKNAFLGYENSIFKKWKNCDFCKGVNPWVWSKIGHFLIFFQALQLRKMCFTIFQNDKTPFQAIKTSSKSGKIAVFAKGLTHGFGPKLAIFPSFFLSIIGQENVFYDILERKNAFLGYKNSMFLKWKN